MTPYIDKKLIKGFEKLEVTDLTDQQIDLLEIIHFHGTVPEYVYKMFFEGAYDFPSDENSARWAVMNQMEKSGFILRHYVPKEVAPGNTISKYEVHPATYDHLVSKYPDYFIDGEKSPKHVFSIGLDQRGETLFQVAYTPTRDILLEANTKYLAHVVIKKGRAILEIKKWS
jgi:hypothetical protein